MTKKIVLFLASVFASSLAHSIVDMKNANFTHSWTDIEVPGPGFQLKVERTYNSRSLFNGMFGFGWCSDFETYSEITPEGNIRIKECGAGQEIIYSPREINKKEIEVTINSIVAKVKAEKKVGATEAYIKQLRDDLQTDDGYRIDYAKKFGIQVKVKEGTKFFANGREVEHFTFDKTYYTRHMADGSMQRHDLNGKLTHIYDKNGNFLKLEYDKDILNQVVDSSNRRLTFKYTTNKKVKSIIGPNGLTAEYKFSNLDDLSWVKNGAKQTFNYVYDDLHNLTKATWPEDGKKGPTFIQIKYDKVKDWVTGFTDRDNCTETYKYESNDADPKSHYSSTATKTCKGKVIVENRYEFWYKNRPDGQYYLSRVLSKIDGATSDVSYHEIFGKPISIRKNNDVITFEYYANGLVKNKTAANMAMNFEYDQNTQKVSKVAVQTLNDKGKKIATKSTEFDYDKKGNLAFAKNSDGQKINMTYDERGRIATIEDQAKKFVKIDYEERFGKPFIVTRPGVGTIKILYKPNGEINKVESKDPIVAMQVASTFNNLMDIIAPANQEIYL